MAQLNLGREAEINQYIKSILLLEKKGSKIYKAGGSFSRNRARKCFVPFCVNTACSSTCKVQRSESRALCLRALSNQHVNL